MQSEMQSDTKMRDAVRDGKMGSVRDRARDTVVIWSRHVQQ